MGDVDSNDLARADFRRTPLIIKLILYFPKTNAKQGQFRFHLIIMHHFQNLGERMLQRKKSVKKAPQYDPSTQLDKTRVFPEPCWSQSY
ncbi:MAG: hypothetical protein A2169_11735 [Deltaproteobacteria bacterium RBG_13_47_9]|nr:MAG: hypothetical protein A2169_11735 [Deltaproteobacteria bacterium RBG_13_47_9]